MEFSQLALQKLLQVFPELANYIVTFKDVTNESGKEEEGVSVGIFILQIGGEFFFVPVVAKGDAVQPIDSIIDNKEQQFMPLTKSFVQKAMTVSQDSLGAPAKVPDTVPTNPSVYNLVTPPRTGKFVYASSSRLVEFLAQLPNMTKQAMVEKFSADKDVYSMLHKLFGLENIFSSLKPVASAIKVESKPAVELITEGKGLDNATVKSILDKGYALRGENTTNRVAVLANDFDAMGKLQNITSSDGGRDFDIVTFSGEAKTAYVPKRAKSAPMFPALLRPMELGAKSIDPVFMLFSNGEFAVSSFAVAKGEGRDGKKALSDLFQFKAPVTPKDVFSGDKIALFSAELEFIGAYYVSNVVISNFGATIKGDSILPFKEMTVNGWGSKHGYGTTINAYRNAKEVDASNPKNIYVPFNVLIVKLGRDITSDLETNINSAAAKVELNTLQALGTAVDIGYDGIEFTFGGKPVGPEVKMVELLVIKEGLAPQKAESFIKQAKESKHIKIYLSKQADFTPGEIPQYGDLPQKQVEGTGLEGMGANFMPNVESSLATGDAQTAESMIISELLQAGDMFDLVNEYLPDIKEALDKLGRTLFLARLNIGQLADSINATEVMAFISNLRNVYRLLGDNYVKLEQLSIGATQNDVPATK